MPVPAETNRAQLEVMALSHRFRARPALPEDERIEPYGAIAKRTAPDDCTFGSEPALLVVISTEDGHTVTMDIDIHQDGEGLLSDFPIACSVPPHQTVQRSGHDHVLRRSR